MRVFVVNMRGEPLMPCSQRKARILLKQNKAKIYKYNPFTIQLTIATGETKQEGHIAEIDDTEKLDTGHHDFLIVNEVRNGCHLVCKIVSIIYFDGLMNCVN